jgi:hypothetical protein
MPISEREDEDNFHVVYNVPTVLKWELIRLDVRDAERGFPEVCVVTENKK